MTQVQHKSRGERIAEGIHRIHSRSCRSLEGRRCNCPPSYQAAVWSARESKRIRKHFESLAEAKAWRQDANGQLRRGEMKAPSRATLAVFAEEWLQAASAGAVLARGGKRYKPSTIRGYRRGLDKRVLPALGHRRLSTITRNEVQALAEQLRSEEMSASTINNTIDPLRSIFRRAIRQGIVSVNPTTDLDLEKPRGRRERIASPREAASLLAALPASERAVWATAFYAGLRRGELRSLRWSDVDLGRSEIRVERSWDAVEGVIDPKSETSARTVPLLAILRDYLDQHKLATERDGEDLVFGRTGADPFVPSTTRNRAIEAWEAAEPVLAPITLHECRHTFASTLIDSGITNAKAIQDAMGHSSIQVTFDLYGHLLPGSRDEVRERVDAYLERTLATT